MRAIYIKRSKSREEAKLIYEDLIRREDLYKEFTRAILFYNTKTSLLERALRLF
jgi:hypothetical protein